MIKAHVGVGVGAVAGQIYCKALFAAFTLACHPQTLGDLAIIRIFPLAF